MFDSTQGRPPGGNHPASFADGPRLLADIGATFARLALHTAPGRLEATTILQCAEYGSPVDILRAYLSGIAPRAPRHAALAIASPIDGDNVVMTNRDWQFSIEDTRRLLGLDTLLVVNDFTALAMALPYLGIEQREQVGGGAPRSDSVIGLVGPGTGLGVSGLIPAEDRWITLGSEGGHTTFAPADARELRVLEFAWREHSHVSAERLVSGPGIELIHRALAETASRSIPARTTPEIISQAMAGEAHCREVIECFCAMLGTVAADVAITLGAVGGIYLGGGVLPRLGSLFTQSGFRRRFEASRRSSSYLAEIPTYLIRAEQPTLLGVAAILADYLSGSEGQSSVLDRVRQSLPGLSPAEQRVGRYLLTFPRRFIHDPVGGIAAATEVSQPTVIRFCRKLGFLGLADCKLKLASGLTGTIPVRHSQVRQGDSAPDLSAKVLDNTLSAIVRLRDNLDTAAVDRAITLLHGAARIEFYGMANSSVVALDGQHKFFRFRIPTSAYADGRLLAMAAELLGPRDVVVAISRSGELREIVQAADGARAAGAKVIAITARDSTLAQHADVLLAVDHSEDHATHISMVSRILHLLMIDILAVGVAMRLAEAGRAGGSALPGAPAGAPLEGLISHTRANQRSQSDFQDS
ncbi:MAG: glucokinase [Pseudomonadota bacterium]|nr:glucokinase [Pseudomonadota bacterium]